MIYKFREKIEKTSVLQDDVWDDIERICEVIMVKKKEILVNYGKLSRDIYFIVSGSFEISLVSRKSGSKTVWFFLDEVFDIAACGDSIFMNEPTKYEITALEDSLVIKFNYDKVEGLADKYSSLSKFVRKDVINDLIQTNEIRNHMTSHTPQEFIDYLKKKYPCILERIPSKNIAYFMGITPEWYSKLKKVIV